MNCLNCNAPNPPSVDRCVACRIPGDFGHAPTPEATVITPKHVDCTNCAGHAPVAAKHCPNCRWPISKREEQPASASAKTQQTLGIQYRQAG